MPKKKTEHYVNNKELLEALIVYRAKVAESFKENNDGREPTKADRSQRWLENHLLQITSVIAF